MASSASMLEVLMNEDLMRGILSCLQGTRDMHSSSLTCKTWYRAQRRVPQALYCNSVLFPAPLAAKFSQVTSLHLSNCLGTISEDDLRDIILQCATTLTELHLQQSGIGSFNPSHPGASSSATLRDSSKPSSCGLSSIGSCVELKKLCLSANVPGLSTSCLRAIAAGCRRLETLDLFQNLRTRVYVDDETTPLMQLPHVFEDDGISGFLGDGSNLRTLNLRSCSGLTDRTLELISNSQTLETLRLDGTFEFTDAGLQLWGIRCASLQDITLSFHLFNELTDKAMVDSLLEGLASHCKDLRAVHVGMPSGQGVRALASLPCLRRVHLAAISDDGGADLAILAQGLHTRLEDLTVARHTPHDVTVVHLAQHCHCLRRLSFPGAKFSDHALDALATMTSLESLTFGSATSSDTWAGTLSSCFIRTGAIMDDRDLESLFRTRAPLQHLSLRGCYRLVRESTLSALANCLAGTLTSLDLSQCCNFPGSAFAGLATLHALKNLNLAGTEVDDVSMHVIITHTGGNLKSLDLTGCSKLLCYSAIAQCTALRTLSLNLCSNVMDNHLAAIADGCSELEWLGLQGSAVTDKGLSALSNCVRLRTLQLASCRGIGKEGLASLPSSCPWLRNLSLPYELDMHPTVSILRDRTVRVSFGSSVCGHMADLG